MFKVPSHTNIPLQKPIDNVINNLFLIADKLLILKRMNLRIHLRLWTILKTS